MRIIATFVLALFASGAVAEDHPAPLHTFKLSNMLSEISGLAAAGPKSVFAHNDEFAIVHEISVSDGEVIRSFALGKPTASGDFEGIAVSGDLIYLLTSNGRLYEAHPADHAARTDYNIYDTGLGAACEFEGLAALSDKSSFLLLCKQAAGDPKHKRLIIYEWSLATRLTPRAPFLDIPLKGLAPKPKKGFFKPAGIEIDPASGNLLIVDSNAGALLEITPAGERVRYEELPPGRHPQAEGIAVMPDGALVIADEGGKKGGRLTVYPAR